MKRRYPDNSFIEISWLKGGTVGTGDGILSVKCSQIRLVGEAEPYFERSELSAYVKDLDSLLDGSIQSATLQSDTGQEEITVERLDSLGHYSLSVRLENDVRLRAKSFRAGLTAFFELDSNEVASLASECGGPEKVGS